MPGGLRVWRAGSGSPKRNSSAPSSAPLQDYEAAGLRVRVVHPFHPWRGRELESVRRQRTRVTDRVLVRGPGGDVVWLPASWTDVVAPDPFVVVSGGRVPFRTADLLAAAELVACLASGDGRGDGSVSGIMS